ncbi:MAG: toll/interleukin-1 receptor domain-containing protein [Acidimicrobiia bacterium]|nr:toll/interleukin-1 receptor domain-containing protein [Acidimicrobiia bacterium]
MKIFISWSGSLSKAVALDLKEWLPKVIQVADPWVSEVDIPKGAAWFDEIRDALKFAAVGIFVVTPESADSVWLNYEAGSIAQILTERRVCPFVVGMTKAQVQPPLGLLNGTEALNRTDVLNFLLTVAADEVRPETVKHAFEREWDEFESSLRTRMEEANAGGAPPAMRTLDDKVDEILGLVRRNEANSKESGVSYLARDKDGRVYITEGRYSAPQVVLPSHESVVEDDEDDDAYLEASDREYEEHRQRALERHFGGDDSEVGE